jgi:hypothetical protein
MNFPVNNRQRKFRSNPYSPIAEVVSSDSIYLCLLLSDCFVTTLLAMTTQRVLCGLGQEVIHKLSTVTYSVQGVV